MIGLCTRRKVCVKIVSTLFICLVLTLARGGGSLTEVYAISDIVENTSQPTGIAASSMVEISLVFQRQSGKSSNQFAVWIEDASGAHIKTLGVTRWTAEGGWKVWEVLLPEWKGAARPQQMSPDTLDAISGATPLSGVLSYTWDCKNENGEIVPEGEYRYLVEGNLRWANRVLYTGKIVIGGSVQQSKAIGEYFSDYIDERTMITMVVVTYYP